jgi:hypothetical protein
VQLDLSGGLGGRTDAPEILAELEVDYTPQAVPLQILLGLTATLRALDLREWHPRHALCPAAGSGCWPRALRALFPNLHITGTDIRESERANLARACDLFDICDAFGDPRGPFDVIADNTPFSAFGSPDREKRVRYWPAEFAARHMLTADGILVMYGLTQWGQGEEAAAHLRIWAPFLCLRCGGRPQHRGVGTQRLAAIPKSRRVPGGPEVELRDNGGDSREYCAWAWRMSDYIRARASEATAKLRGEIWTPPRPSWLTVQLPVLPSGLREWHPNAVPGTYPIDPALVAEVRKYL